MSEEQPGQPRMSVHVGCRQRNGAPVSGDSLLIATEALQGHAEIAVQSGEFGVERGCSLEAFGRRLRPAGGEVSETKIIVRGDILQIEPKRFAGQRDRFRAIAL
ncbi:MAG: hypothetical protein WB678_16725 [Stellaceae bacterium]